MTHVTVFRCVPKPIIGMVSVVNDPQFKMLEESLDWLETTGLLVERFDPAADPFEVEAHPTARHLLLAGDGCLPLVLVDEAVVLQGTYPSRTQLARAVGSAGSGVGRADRPAA